MLLQEEEYEYSDDFEEYEEIPDFENVEDIPDITTPGVSLYDFAMNNL
jgi:hypothetical protein